jgi:acetoin utilization deacetylase AcuC-like enzyme
MDACFSEHHAAHHDQVELIGGRFVKSFELPVRAERVREAFLAARLGRVLAPHDFGLAPLLAVHEREYVQFLRSAWDDWRALGRTHPALPMVWHAGLGPPTVAPRHIEGRLGYYSMDAGCAIVEGTWDAAYWSAMCALTAASQLHAGAAAAFAVCRPPGHHAAARAMGGYCYLNNAAIAAQWLRHQGHPRVAMLDIDYHHGNGTQSIFWQRGDVFVASLHADPHDDYPYLSGHAHERGEGAGAGCNLNLPLPAGTRAAGWLAALEVAIDAIRAHGARIGVVSLGVDTFELDPISGFKLTEADYPEIGRRLQRLGMPLLFVFEGGYATDEVGRNAVGVLRGFEAG